MSVNRVSPTTASHPATNSNVPVAKIWCSTRAKNYEFSYTWSIRDFAPNIEKMGDSYAVMFTAETNDNIRFILKLNTHSGENRDYISLKLSLSSCDKTKTIASSTMSIMNGHQPIHTAVAVRSDGNLLCHQFIKRDILLDKTNGLLAHNMLTIFCEGIVWTPCNFSDQSNCVAFKKTGSNLSQNFANLFNNPQFSDVTIAVEGHEYKAHKFILSARSEVFAAMFEHDMEENISNRVKITDIEPEVLKEMLYFIYTDMAPNLHEMAVELLIAADKYALERLKVMCEKALSENLNIDNAEDTLDFADRIGALQLTTYAQRFIRRKMHRQEMIDDKNL